MGSAKVSLEDLQGAVAAAVLAEREACAKIAAALGHHGGDCEWRGMMDPETGTYGCVLEDRDDICECVVRNEQADKIAAAIRARSGGAS